MTKYTTTIQAINPQTGKITSFCGPVVEGISFADAQNYCDNNGLGYCHVDGILIYEIPVKNGDPDFKEKKDYTNSN